MYQVSYRRGVAFIDVLGEMDSRSCGTLANVLQIQGVKAAQSVTISFARCASLDVSCILMLLNEQGRDGRRFRIVATPESGPGRIFAIPTISAHFDVVDAIGPGTSFLDNTSA